MDPILSTLLSWQLILFSLAIAAVTYVIRTVVEFYILDNPKVPATRQSRAWTELFLPIMPVLLGLLFGMIAKQFPYPQNISSSSARAAFGLVGGLFSGLLYRVLKGMLMSKVTYVQTKVEDANALVDQVNDENKALIAKVSSTITKE